MDRKPDIVVVEHDPYLGMLLLEVLTEQGYAVHLWTERRGAVELIRQTRPDLVILDLWCGVAAMDGRSTRRCRLIRPRLRSRSCCAAKTRCSGQMAHGRASTRPR